MLRSRCIGLARTDSIGLTFLQGDGNSARLIEDVSRTRGLKGNGSIIFGSYDLDRAVGSGGVVTRAAVLHRYHKVGTQTMLPLEGIDFGIVLSSHIVGRDRYRRADKYTIVVGYAVSGCLDVGSIVSGRLNRIGIGRVSLHAALGHQRTQTGRLRNRHISGIAIGNDDEPYIIRYVRGDE